MQILELQCTIGRINFPKYDGSIECTTRARVGKLNTFFQLNRVTEGEAIRMDTSHLEDEGTQDHWEHVDTPSVTQGSPVLETSLTMSVDILVERVEATPIVSSIEVMTGVVYEASGGSKMRQMGEVP